MVEEPATMIQADNLTKYYGDLLAIEDVTFSVKRGEVLGFLGPNAAGKTTTMRILTGFMPPSAGTAKVAGYDVFADSIEVRRRIGYLPERVPLYDEMTVRGYLDFAAALRATDRRSEAVDRAMELTNVVDRADTMIAKLSKGYRQRVGLAQALVHDPEILILDEPTIGLDPKQILEVRKLIKELSKEHTILLSTHILPEASQVCQRVLIISKGRIVAEDRPERLTARLQGGERVIVRIQGEPDRELLDQLQCVDGVSAAARLPDGGIELQCTLGLDRRAEIARTVVNRGWDLVELRTVGMSLEDIFLELTALEEE